VWVFHFTSLETDFKPAKLYPLFHIEIVERGLLFVIREKTILFSVISMVFLINH